MKRALFTLLYSAALLAAAPSLHQAALTGSVEQLRQMIAQGANVKDAGKLGITPLHFAATEPAKVRVLLNAGADANAASAQGRTPLMVAAAAGAIESARLLMAKGADVKARDKAGATAALLAAANGHEELTRMLVERGADVNAVDAAGFTLLHSAAAHMPPPMVRWLLARGAKPDLANTDGGRVPKGEIALKGLTPLMLAAPYAPKETLQALLDAGANVNSADVRGMTPLMLAVASERQSPAAVRLLLQRGARLDAKSHAGETAIDWARKYQRPEILQALGVSATKMEKTAMPPFVQPKSESSAVTQALALLEDTSESFFREGGCFACHHSMTTAMAQHAAATHGYAINQKVATTLGQGAGQFFRAFEPTLALMMDPPGAADTVIYMLAGMAAAGIAPNSTTDAMALYVARAQRDDGSWSMAGIARPPVEDGGIHRTAMAWQALDRYFPATLAAEKTERLARARQALMRLPAVTTDDAAMKVLGLRWANASTGAALQDLLKRQRADGGWGANRHLPSDAYSTAVATVALREAHGPVPAAERGGLYLVMTQERDGSWHVPSRSPKFQPYFESGFPHGHDQWISNAATAWAVRALAGLERRQAIAGTMYPSR